MIDKNGGADYPVRLLRDWKEKHHSIVSSLLRTHRSPLPILRRITMEGEIAQTLVDTLENHGALFQSHNLEVPAHVTTSIERLRNEVIALNGSVRYDMELKSLLKEMASYCRDFMNNSAAYSSQTPHELDALRIKIGRLLGRLEREFGCKIQGPIRQFVS